MTAVRVVVFVLGALVVAATVASSIRTVILPRGVPARLARVVYGARDPKAGAVESLHRMLDDARLNHRVSATGGVLASESAALLRAFFDTRRS